jgi:hypothetical protein
VSDSVLCSGDTPDQATWRLIWASASPLLLSVLLSLHYLLGTYLQTSLKPRTAPLDPEWMFYGYIDIERLSKMCLISLYMGTFFGRDILSISPILQNQNRNSVRSAKIQFHNLLFRDGDVKHFSLTTFEN